ncbi:MAG TPA: hypothetical protein VFQ76_08745 [Longimicrobiaceae bacterium]|nr:hypothetical protein [Longimicrobiaceae bacterium]
MRILFWNVQRLGGGTGELRSAILEGVIASAFYDDNAEAAVLCEVTSGTTLSNATIDKQITVAKRTTKGSKAQLGYAAIESDLSTMEMEQVLVSDYSDVFGTPVPKKGGNMFDKQSKRFVAFAGTVGGTNLYVYHANASARAPFLVAWVAEDLRQQDGGNFVLVGDLNCDPAAVVNALTSQGANPAHFHVRNGGNTHNAKKGVSKIYDYAICGVANNNLAVTVKNIRPHLPVNQLTNLPDDSLSSDHLPILVDF